MSPKSPQEKEVLQQVLEPLLEDFQYWFSRAHSLLESERLPFLSESEQAELLEKIKSSQQEVATAQILFKATNKEVGLDSSILLPWHELVTQCWQIASKWRNLQQ